MKKCLVPICTNTEILAPGKIYVMVPLKEERRKKWFTAIFGPEKKPSKSKYLYVCEDHFDLQEDAENFLQYRTVDTRLFMKSSAVPHKNLQTTVKLPNQTSAPEKRKIDNFEILRRLRRLESRGSSTSTFPEEIIIEELPSPSGAFEIQTWTSGEEIEGCSSKKLKKKLQSSSSSTSSNSSSFVPLSSADEIMIESKKVPMQNLNLKVTKHNIETNSKLVVGLKKLQSSSSSTGSNSSSFVPLSSADEIRIESKDPMQNLNLKVTKHNIETNSKLVVGLKKLQSSSFSTSSNSSSFVPLSSADEIRIESKKDPMQKLNSKVTKHNIETNSSLFLGLPDEEFFVIKLLEEKCKVRYENIMLTLKKVRCNDSYKVLSILFGKSESSVEKIFFSTVLAIANELQSFIYFPSNEDIFLTMPLQFLPAYKNVISIIDCLEIEISTPVNARLQALTWNQYKKSYTIKYLISSTPNGLINYVSMGFGGSTSDREILEKSDYLKLLPNNCTILADCGFKNIESLLNKKNCKLMRPAFITSGQQMNKAQIIKNRRILSCKIHIERVIRRIREFKMLEPHSEVHSSLIQWLDYVVIIACGIINTHGSLFK